MAIIPQEDGRKQLSLSFPLVSSIHWPALPESLDLWRPLPLSGRRKVRRNSLYESKGLEDSDDPIEENERHVDSNGDADREYWPAFSPSHVQHLVSSERS